MIQPSASPCLPGCKALVPYDSSVASEIRKPPENSSDGATAHPEGKSRSFRAVSKEIPCRLLIETTALTRPGQERGLGRYASACLAGAHAIGCEVTELRVRNRDGRAAEFIDLAERSVLAFSHKRDIFHVTHPRVWSPSWNPTVASILDLIPMDIPGYSQTGIKSRFFLSRAAQARVILTISNFTADRILQRFNVDPDQVIVAPLFPVATFHAGSASPPPLELPDPYVLTVLDMASSDPRKRPGWIAPLAQDLERAA